MSFFKDFKQDLSQAVNELMPDSNEMYDQDEIIDETSQQAGFGKTSTDEDFPAKERKLNKKKNTAEKKETKEYEKLSGKSQKETLFKRKRKEKSVRGNDLGIAPEDMMDQRIDALLDYELYSDDVETQLLQDGISQEQRETEEIASIRESTETEMDLTTQEIISEDMKENIIQEEDGMIDEKDIISITPAEENAEEIVDEVKDEVEEDITGDVPFRADEADPGTTYIAEGTTLTGDLDTEGSIHISGTIEGNINCKNKVVIGGQVNGNIATGELYANGAKIHGEIQSTGSVKIGVGSMIVGDIHSESAVIAGAVNGDIDVKGPVIVDSTAVIMGNIKSRSVQINNGAVIEGFCSQSYSEIDVKSFFA